MLIMYFGKLRYKFLYPEISSVGICEAASVLDGEWVTLRRNATYADDDVMPGNFHVTEHIYVEI